MRVGSLFTGIGGLDLGLSRAGFELAWQVEIDPWCRKLLTQHWPEVPKFGDIKLCGAHNLEYVDLIVGGFPCQDISTAGKQAGIEEGKQSGLWREQARIIAEIRPRYVLIENVAALLYATKRPDGTRRPAAIQRVLRDLAASGYDGCWRVCSAAESGAPHLRKRVFIVAYLPEQQGSPQWTGTADVGNSAGARWQERSDTTGLHSEPDTSGQPLADTDGDRCGLRQDQPEPGSRRNGAPDAGKDGKHGHVADAEQQQQGPFADRAEDASGLPPTAQPARVRQSSQRGHVADAASAGRAAGEYPGRAEPSGKALIHDAQHGGEGVADASRQRLEIGNGRGPAPARTRATTDEYCSGQVESCLGGDADGISRELDEAFLNISAVFDGLPPSLDSIEHRWPARPGQEQYSWEPPRVIEGKLPDRVARLKGLGNAALPQIAEAIGRGIQRHNARRQKPEANGC